MIIQAKLRSFRNSPKYEFGSHVPNNHKEAVVYIGNTKRHNAEVQEREQLLEHDSFKSHKKGAKLLTDYKLIHVHFVYDIKHHGRHKARLVSG